MFARPALALAALITLAMPGYASYRHAATYTELTNMTTLESSASAPELPELEALAARPFQPLAQPRVAPAQSAASCDAELPTPAGRWAGRDSDDEWARGLYPHHDDYGDALALTFDDGPHRARTPLALDELAAHGLHATFFLTGNAIQARTYDLVQRMVAEGHALANHGWRHDINMVELDGLSPAQLRAYIASEFELTQIRVDLALIATSPEHFAELDAEVFAGLHRFRHDRLEQLARLERLRARHLTVLERHGYDEDDRPYAMSYVRPPGGSPYLGGRWSVREREIFAQAINDERQTIVMWNAGSGDSNTKLSPRERRDPARVAETARASAAKGGIYIAHDRIDPEAMRAMLTAFATSEVEIVSLDELRARKLEHLGLCS